MNLPRLAGEVDGAGRFYRDARAQGQEEEAAVGGFGQDAGWISAPLRYC